MKLFIKYNKPFVDLATLAIKVKNLFIGSAIGVAIQKGR